MSVKTYTPSELKEILEAHRKWREGDPEGRRANLRGANLRGANLRGANLGGADLAEAKLSPFLIVPEEGSFVGWKKTNCGVILKLEIPADAARASSLVGRKCRASKVKVLEAFGAAEGQTAFASHRDSGFVYRLGEAAEADDFDPDIRVECTNGIHFFVTRAEAERYEWT